MEGSNSGILPRPPSFLKPSVENALSHCRNRPGTPLLVHATHQQNANANAKKRSWRNHDAQVETYQTRHQHTGRCIALPALRVCTPNSLLALVHAPPDPELMGRGALPLNTQSRRHARTPAVCTLVHIHTSSPTISRRHAHRYSSLCTQAAPPPAPHTACQRLSSPRAAVLTPQAYVATCHPCVHGHNRRTYPPHHAMPPGTPPTLPCRVPRPHTLTLSLPAGHAIGHGIRCTPSIPPQHVHVHARCRASERVL